MVFLIALIVVAGLSSLIILHELGHFTAAKIFGLRVEEFGFGIPPRAWGKKVGETLVSINWLPIGGFVKIFGLGTAEGRSKGDTKDFNNLPLGRRMIVVAAGVVVNVIIGWWLIAAVFMIGVPSALVVAEVVPNSIASEAGFKVNDAIVGFGTYQDFTQFVAEHKSVSIPVSVRRGGEEITMYVIPRSIVPEGEGNLGIALVETGAPKLGFLGAMWRSLLYTGQMLVRIVVGFGQLLMSIISNWAGLSMFVGPVGVVGVATEATKMGAVYFIQFLAVVSLNLAVFNTLPVPALDGGRLVLLIIEKIKGTPVSHRFEALINGIGFAFLILLMCVVTVKDIAALL